MELSMSRTILSWYKYTPVSVPAPYPGTNLHWVKYALASVPALSHRGTSILALQYDTFSVPACYQDPRRHIA
eukprot:3496705-Rhodomonas_salina.1